jgi:hypothetical protein
MSTTLPPCEAEWLEADGTGGFASGTVSGVRIPPVPRTACPGDNAASRPYGSGERVRDVGGALGRHLRHFLAALQSCCRHKRRTLATQRKRYPVVECGFGRNVAESVPRSGGDTGFNSVDASLRYIIAVHDYLECCQNQSPTVFLRTQSTQF